VTLNSKNSSKPPASDPKRKKGQRKKSDKSSGGQKSHIGTTLQKIEEPDEIEIITIDRLSLPKGRR
jgi:transposase